MKTKKTIELSTKSLNNAINYINKFNEKYNSGISKGVEEATKSMYEMVLRYCYDNGISEHTNNIYYEYDPYTNTGKVWSNDEVIIFNEMGTGIVGSNNPHPNPQGSFASWKYDVNEHGEKGWKYPKSDGTFGWTKGLPSRHMFYSAFNNIKGEIGDKVSIEIRKSIGDLY